MLRIKFARRREGVTDYKKRFGMLKSKKPRLVIRQTNRKLIAQLVVFDGSGDRVAASALSSDLKNFGWNHSVKSVPAAYLTGALIGARARSAHISECIADFGLKTITRGSRFFAVVKGACDAGLSVPHSAENLPSDERIHGKHIAAYRKIDISADFGTLKEKINSEGGKALGKKPGAPLPKKKKP